MGMSIKKLHTVVLLYDIYSLIAHFPEKSLETSFRRFHVLAEQKVSYNRPQPHIAQERQNKYHQLIILESLFEVTVKNAGDSPGHATTGTANAKHVANQAKGSACLQPGSGNHDKKEGQEKQKCCFDRPPDQLNYLLTSGKPLLSL